MILMLSFWGNSFIDGHYHENKKVVYVFFCISRKNIHNFIFMVLSIYEYTLLDDTIPPHSGGLPLVKKIKKIKLKINIH